MPCSIATRPLSPVACRWIERSLEPGVRVVGVKRLTGGLMSVVHRVAVAAGGMRRIVVLKEQLSVVDRAPADADLLRREAATLRRIASAGLLAPEVLAASLDGQAGIGHPALLLTHRPGRIDLAPRDGRAWIRSIARTAARIHDAPASGPPVAGSLVASRGAPPADAASPAVWRDALAGIGREPPVREPAFVHGDFQHFNLLFRRGDVSGVLDWGAAGRGPAELDVGHCRLNIAVLFSAELAEQLREAYEAETGRRLVPAWDVHALLSYSGAWRRFIPVQVAGRVPVDGAGMTARVEALLRAALRRRG